MSPGSFEASLEDQKVSPGSLKASLEDQKVSPGSFEASLEGPEVSRGSLKASLEDPKVSRGSFISRKHESFPGRPKGISQLGPIRVALASPRGAWQVALHGCARHGFPFVETQPGVRESSQLAMRFFAIDLVTIGAQTPEHPINLLSARRREYGSSGLPRSLGPFDVLYEQVFLTELKKTSQLHVPGTQELLDDSDDLNEFFVARATVERRLSSPDDLTKVLAHATVEQRLRGLSPEEMLRGLGAAERARLRELLLQQEDR